MDKDQVNNDRRLTDADIRALADELECRMVKRFYLNIGRGVLGLAWKAVVMLIIALAAYGAFKGGAFWR